MKIDTKTADLGFSAPSWADWSEEGPDSFDAARLDPRCAFPDCRRAFTRSTRGRGAQAVYCCADCRRADGDESRRIGHIIAKPALIARQTKHAKDWQGKERNRKARGYVDHIVGEWKNARARRAADAEARADAEAAADMKAAA